MKCISLKDYTNGSMRLHLSLILSLLLAHLFVSTPASAQEEENSNPNTPLPLIETDAGKRAYQTLQVEYLRIQNASLKRKKNDGAVNAQLLSVLEDLAMYACSMMVSGKWDFQLNDAPGDCKQYLDKLTKLSTPSAVPGCIKEGRDSQACAQLFSSQQTLSIYDFPSASTAHFQYEDLGDGFSSSIPPALRQRIQNVQFQLSSTEETEKIASLKRELLQNQLQALAISCTEQPLVYYKPLSEIGIHKESFQGREDPDTERIKTLIQSYRDEITKEQKKLKAEATSLLENPPLLPVSTPSPATSSSQELVRIRLVSAQCVESINYVLSSMPLSAHAICKRDGIFHPTCIQAMSNRSSQNILNKEPDPATGIEKVDGGQYSTF